jgi:hypothetical protein
MDRKMKTPANNPNPWGAAFAASKVLTERDAEAHTEKQAAKESAGAMPLDAIKARPDGDTRHINGDHVLALADSMEALGLLEPLVVDNAGHLLAGGHRLEAVRLLDKAGKWGKPVPVRIIDFDAVADKERAFAIEVAENEQRRDYTVTEVRHLADRLQGAGYLAEGGRPGRGKKALMPALETIVGKSARQIRRYLNPETRTDVLVSNPVEVAEKKLASAVAGYLKATDGKHGAKVRRILEALAPLEALLDTEKETTK